MIYSVEDIRNTVTPIAKKYNISSVFLFGSYARGTATEKSDIDLLIDTTGSEIDTLFKLGEIYQDLCDVFQKDIDLITVSSLEQNTIRQSENAFRDNIYKERLNLYAVA